LKLNQSIRVGLALDIIREE